jgi:hypothetical protein
MTLRKSPGMMHGVRSPALSMHASTKKIGKKLSKNGLGQNQLPNCWTLYQILIERELSIKSKQLSWSITLFDFITGLPKNSWMVLQKN